MIDGKGSIYRASDAEWQAGGWEGMRSHIVPDIGEKKNGDTQNS